jgi:hypothetical protein
LNKARASCAPPVSVETALEEEQRRQPAAEVFRPLEAQPGGGVGAAVDAGSRAAALDDPLGAEVEPAVHREAGLRARRLGEAAQRDGGDGRACSHGTTHLRV